MKSTIVISGICAAIACSTSCRLLLFHPSPPSSLSHPLSLHILYALLDLTNSPKQSHITAADEGSIGSCRDQYGHCQANTPKERCDGLFQAGGTCNGNGYCLPFRNDEGGMYTAFGSNEYHIGWNSTQHCLTPEGKTSTDRSTLV